MQALVRDTGLSPQVVVFFLQWPAPGVNGFVFPGETLTAIGNQGALPCLTWEPMHYHNGKETMILHDEIMNGRYDDYLVRFAGESRRFGKPFLIRFAHEMNIHRYHWGAKEEDYGPASPELYQRMFRYVVSVFRREKADNVRWAFCPNAESLPTPGRDPGAGWNTLGAYYPGDDWVDILGIDGYNWGTSRKKELHGWDSNWRSFGEIFGAAYEEIRGLSPGKPVFIFETASVTAGGDRREWIAAMLATLKAWKISGVCWFQVNKDNDWRLGSDGDRSYLPLIRRAIPAAAVGQRAGEPWEK